jgi:hypothetical protein
MKVYILVAFIKPVDLYLPLERVIEIFTIKIIFLDMIFIVDRTTAFVRRTEFMYIQSYIRLAHIINAKILKFVFMAVNKVKAVLLPHLYP